MRVRKLEVLGSLLIVVLCTANAFAQRATGAITGRVVTDDGQPVRHATISISSMGGGGRSAGRLTVVSDEDGNFQAEGLDPVPYTISATAPGYVLDPKKRRETNYSFVGQAVTVTMIRGGVITGKVTSATGDPIIRIAVRAIRVRDETGRPDNTAVGNFRPQRMTDDRGVYRLYGLAPGSYLVSAGGANMNSSRQATPYHGRITTYHPSATRDAATEVKVIGGDEVSGVDIRFRGERGYAISGKIIGVPRAGTQETGTNISLRNPATGAIIATTFLPREGDQTGYAFYGVPNGEYLIMSTRGGFNDPSSMSATPRRVTVNGRDVTGFDLTLTPNAAIEGTVTIEKVSSAEKCVNPRESYLEEIVVRAKREDAGARTDQPYSFYSPMNFIGLNAKGAFAVRNLRPGPHRIDTELPSEDWYLKTMTMTGATPTIDPRNGITVKSGDRVEGLTITLATGAAGLKGKIISAGGARLPSRLRVHLVPAEPPAKDDVLRFAETPVESDGSFRFTNLAPGKYLITTREIPGNEAPDEPARPVAWDAAERAKLRKEAEAAKVEVELNACQRVSDFELKHVRREQKAP
ncbi:MAG TPA: carboxypeptidase regulatory-like domain-containing protein [Blastocatellia bacterium]|nr:carboxypeptidase regulatory-like domain-containing protein [Blastocatellia bacterium]